MRRFSALGGGRPLPSVARIRRICATRPPPGVAQKPPARPGRPGAQPLPAHAAGARAARVQQAVFGEADRCRPKHRGRRRQRTVASRCARLSVVGVGEDLAEGTEPRDHLGRAAAAGRAQAKSAGRMSTLDPATVLEDPPHRAGSSEGELARPVRTAGRPCRKVGRGGTLRRGHERVLRRVAPGQRVKRRPRRRRTPEVRKRGPPDRRKNINAEARDDPVERRPSEGVAPRIGLDEADREAPAHRTRRGQPPASGRKCRRRCSRRRGASARASARVTSPVPQPMSSTRRGEGEGGARTGDQRVAHRREHGVDRLPRRDPAMALDAVPQRPLGACDVASGPPSPSPRACPPGRGGDRLPLQVDLRSSGEATRYRRGGPADRRAGLDPQILRGEGADRLDRPAGPAPPVRTRRWRSGWR